MPLEVQAKRRRRSRHHEQQILLMILTVFGSAIVALSILIASTDNYDWLLKQ
jgi:hypothetical protein